MATSQDFINHVVKQGRGATKVNTIRRSLAVAAFAMAALAGCASQPPSTMSVYDQGVLAYNKGNYRLARKHWSTALLANRSASAANNLGYLYYNGLGGKEDPDAAVELWMQAIESGIPESFSHIGRSYREGKGNRQDLVQAYAWYRCAIAATKTGRFRDADLNASMQEEAEAAIRELLPHLTDEQFAAAEALAQERVPTIYKIFGSP